jgi:P27 family predicted phage terminase small subunit
VRVNEKIAKEWRPLGVADHGPPPSLNQRSNLCGGGTSKFWDFPLPRRAGNFVGESAFLGIVLRSAAGGVNLEVDHERSEASPLELRLVRGNPGKRPLKPEPLPALPMDLEPPDFLSEEAKAEWRRVGPELRRLNLLTVLDTPVFGAYCEAYSTMVLAERLLAESGGKLTVMTPRGSQVPNPLVRIATDSAEAMLRYGSEFGMTPSSRSRLGVDPNPPGSKFGDLLKG